MKMPAGKSANEVILKIYPGAYNGFDMEGADMVRGVLSVSLRSVDWDPWVRIKDRRLGNGTVRPDSSPPAGNSRGANAWDF